ncbi:CBS domain-containing protein, partial [Streptomyces xantholiticus]
MLHRRTVGDVMTEELVTLRPNTPVQEVVGLLDANDIASAPVVGGGGGPRGGGGGGPGGGGGRPPAPQPTGGARRTRGRGAW